MSRYLLLLLPLAVAACGENVAVLTDRELPDAQTEASPEGLPASDAAPDVASPDRDAGDPEGGDADAESADVWTDAGADAGADVIEALGDAAADVNPADPCGDAGECPLGNDGAVCVNASYFGCVVDPPGPCPPDGTLGYICSNPYPPGFPNGPPGCSQRAGVTNVWCCNPVCPYPLP